jgi:hypothetical protein
MREGDRGEQAAGSHRQGRKAPLERDSARRKGQGLRSQKTVARSQEEETQSTRLRPKRTTARQAPPSLPIHCFRHCTNGHPATRREGRGRGATARLVEQRVAGTSASADSAAEKGEGIENSRQRAAGSKQPKARA